MTRGIQCICPKCQKEIELMNVVSYTGKIKLECTCGYVFEI